MFACPWLIPLQKPLDDKFFHVLRYVTDFSAKTSAASNQVPLRDALLRDTLTRAPEIDPEHYQCMVKNIQLYVDLVHHTQYTAEFMQRKRYTILYMHDLMSSSSRRTRSHRYSSTDCGLGTGSLCRDPFTANLLYPHPAQQATK